MALAIFSPLGEEGWEIDPEHVWVCNWYKTSGTRKACRNRV